MIDRVSQDRTAFDFEHRLLMPNGSVKYVRVVGRPSVEDKSGNFEFVGAIIDITDESKLRRSARTICGYWKAWIKLTALSKARTMSTG